MAKILPPGSIVDTGLPEKDPYTRLQEMLGMTSNVATGLTNIWAHRDTSAIQGINTVDILMSQADNPQDMKIIDKYLKNMPSTYHNAALTTEIEARKQNFDEKNAHFNKFEEYTSGLMGELTTLNKDAAIYFEDPANLTVKQIQEYFGKGFEGTYGELTSWINKIDKVKQYQARAMGVTSEGHTLPHNFTFTNPITGEDIDAIEMTDLFGQLKGRFQTVLYGKLDESGRLNTPEAQLFLEGNFGAYKNMQSAELDKLTKAHNTYNTRLLSVSGQMKTLAASSNLIYNEAFVSGQMEGLVDELFADEDDYQDFIKKNPNIPLTTVVETDKKLIHDYLMNGQITQEKLKTDLMGMELDIRKKISLIERDIINWGGGSLIGIVPGTDAWDLMTEEGPAGEEKRNLVTGESRYDGPSFAEAEQSRVLGKGATAAEVGADLTTPKIKNIPDYEQYTFKSPVTGETVIETSKIPSSWALNTNLEDSGKSWSMYNNVSISDTSGRQLGLADETKIILGWIAEAEHGGIPSHATTYKNKNGSIDIGVHMINEAWINKPEHHHNFAVNKKFNERDVVYDEVQAYMRTQFNNWDEMSEGDRKDALKNADINSNVAAIIYTRRGIGQWAPKTRKEVQAKIDRQKSIYKNYTEKRIEKIKLEENIETRRKSLRESIKPGDLGSGMAAITKLPARRELANIAVDFDIALEPYKHKYEGRVYDSLSKSVKNISNQLSTSVRDVAFYIAPDAVLENLAGMKGEKLFSIPSIPLLGLGNKDNLSEEMIERYEPEITAILNIGTDGWPDSKEASSMLVNIDILIESLKDESKNLKIPRVSLPFAGGGGGEQVEASYTTRRGLSNAIKALKKLKSDLVKVKQFNKNNPTPLKNYKEVVAKRLKKEEEFKGMDEIKSKLAEEAKKLAEESD